MIVSFNSILEAIKDEEKERRYYETENIKMNRELEALRPRLIKLESALKVIANHKLDEGISLYSEISESYHYFKRVAKNALESK